MKEGFDIINMVNYTCSTCSAIKCGLVVLFRLFVFSFLLGPRFYSRILQIQVGAMKSFNLFLELCSWGFSEQLDVT